MSNKGQPGWDNQTPAWKSEFATTTQVRENITTEQSLDIIENASRYGVSKTDGNGRVIVPQATTSDGQVLSLRVRDAKALEDSNKANPPTGNPFLVRNQQQKQPAKKNLSDLP